MAELDSDKLAQELRDYVVNLAGSQGREQLAIASDTDLIEMGVFDSMTLLDFVVFIEKRCGTKIPGEDIEPENFGTLGSIVQYLSASS
jgi:acyl carrier protein